MMKSPFEMTQNALNVAIYKTKKQPLTTFVSAILGGAFIAIAFIFYVTVKTGSQGVSWGLINLVAGIVFSLGLILVVVFAVDLFTSTTLTVLGPIKKQFSLKSMLKNWVTVYLGNLVGAIFLVFLIFMAGQYMQAHGQWGLTVLKVSEHKLSHTFIEAVCLGILCNVMVCGGVWLSYAGKSLTDKTLILILPIAMFVASGFEHCVANMFMLPLGYTIYTFADASFWQMVNIDPSVFSDITITNIVFKNLIPVTLGNIIGGSIFIALPQWFLHLKNE